MRLWTLHPSYLDRAGLSALWREGLLAQSVLIRLAAASVSPFADRSEPLDKTDDATRRIGYRNHPQLNRFKTTTAPIDAIGDYLAEIAAEGKRRGYRFDENKIVRRDGSIRIPVAVGQIEYERDWLIAKLRRRDSDRAAFLRDERTLLLNSIFFPVPGDVEAWEKR